MGTDMTAVEQATGPDLQPGEAVDVTIRGAVFAYADPFGATFHYPGRGPDGGVKDRYVTVDLADGTVRVERAIPADGEPQPGDLWRGGEGHLYAAVRKDLHPDPGLVNVSTGTAFTSWRHVHAHPLLGPIALDHRPVVDPSLAQVAAAALTPDEVA
jgi:hypothetical protein